MNENNVEKSRLTCSCKVFKIKASSAIHYASIIISYTIFCKNAFYVSTMARIMKKLRAFWEQSEVCKRRYYFLKLNAI